MKLIRIALAIGLSLAAVPLAAQQPSQHWSALERLPFGGIIAVREESGAVFRGRVLRADADSILLFAPKTVTPALKPVEKLINNGVRQIGHVDQRPVLFEESGLLVGVDGISINGTRVGAFDDVFHVTSRGAVVSVVRPKDQRHSVWGTVAGIAIGAGAGIVASAAILLSDDPCQPNCGPVALKGYSLLVGGPILGGLAGRAIAKPRQDLVIYRR